MTTLLTIAQREALKGITERWHHASVLAGVLRAFGLRHAIQLPRLLLARDAQLQTEAIDGEMAQGCLAEIHDQLVKLGVDMSGTPPMMYPEAICEAVRRYADPAKLVGRDSG